MKFTHYLLVLLIAIVFYGCKSETQFKDILGKYDGKVTLGGGLSNINYKLTLNADSTFTMQSQVGSKEDKPITGKFIYHDIHLNDANSMFGEITKIEQKSVKIIEFISIFEIDPELYESIKDIGNPRTNRKPGDLIHSFLIYNENDNSMFVYPRTSLQSSMSVQGKLPFFLVSDDKIIFKKP